MIVATPSLARIDESGRGMLQQVTVRDRVETTTEVCAKALQEPALRECADALRAAGYARAELCEIAARVSDAQSTQEPVRALHAACASLNIAADLRAVERVLLLNASIESLHRLPHLPVSDDVKALFCEEFCFYASPPGEHAARYDVGTASFVAMCKTATLRRFPAGQFDWEVGGIRRSDIGRVSVPKLVPTILFAALRMRGLQPVFFSHLNWRRPHRSLIELEANRSYYRMAQALRLQPGIKGFAACSWFRSPGVHRVSPHLAWLSRVILENGGFVVEAGVDSPESGVLHRSRTRRSLYEAGKFRPSKGLVMWPREAMIGWAAAHPEFESRPTRAGEC
jgi:transposase InsO family protein